MNATEAAERLVDRALSYVTGIEPNLVDVAAATLVERARPGAMDPMVREVLGRAEAMSFAVGAALGRSDARGLVDLAWSALQPQQRGFAANALDVVLAGIDMRWAWSLVETAVHETQAGVLVAMLADAAGLAPILPAPHAARLSAFHLLRDAVLDPDAARPEVLTWYQRGAWLAAPFDVQVFTLAACALVEPLAALAALGRHDLQRKHGDVMTLLCHELHARGDDAAWLATLPPAEPYYARTGWLSCAIEAKILTGTRAHSLVMDALDAVSRNAEADEEAVECYPLVAALVELDRPSDVVAWADRVRMPPGLLADLLFWTNKPRVATAVLDAGAFERLTARPREDWSSSRSWGPQWWYDALEAGTVLDTSKQVATLAGQQPWRHPPDSLETFIELVRNVSVARSG